MDYKIVIILLALLFLIILIYREMSTLKDQVLKNSTHISTQFRQNNDSMMVKFQNNMNKYLSQIKGISCDNLQQLRKITLLNHQPVIRKFSNHFTETDGSEIGTGTGIHYLSDRKAKKISEENNKIFEKKEPSQYYMSEDTKKGSEHISENAERSPGIENICEKDTIEQIPIYVSNKTQNVDHISEGDESSSDSVSTEESLDGDNIYVEEEIPINNRAQLKQSDDNLLNKSIIDEESEELILIEVTPLQYKDDPKNKNEIEVDMFNVISGNTLLSSVNSNNIKDLIKDTSVTNENNENLPENEELLCTHKSELVSEDSFNAEKSLPKIYLSESNLIEQQQEEPQHHENLETPKPKRGRKKIIVNTSDIILKKYNEYTLQDLKKMAKKLQVPITYREKDKVKQYKKEALYKNIDNYLKKKHSSNL